MCGIVVPNTFRACVSVSRVTCLRLILLQDWPRHRLECVPIASARSNMLANPPHVQPRLITVSAILFAPQEGIYLVLLLGVHASLTELPDRPRVITVTCEPPSTPALGTCPTPLIQGYFPGEHADSMVLTQGLNGEPLRFPLQVWYSPGALAVNAPINQAIIRITSGSASKPWCGPVIVLKYNGSRRQGYSDAGSNDLPALSAYFLAYK
jgi:hypothetical protein